MLGTRSQSKLSGIPYTSKLKETNIPKSAITISDSESFVRYNMFSGLVICQVKERSRTQNIEDSILQIPVDDVVIV